MNKAAAFDPLAPVYDTSFTNSLTGRYQRNISRRWLKKFLDQGSSLNILEINCGTGEDAHWLASLGHTVYATDASPNMISQAMAKGQKTNLRFSVVSFEALQSTFEGQSFDLIFSNFAGLNCMDAIQLQELLCQLHPMLRDNGHLAFVVFGKKCLWEKGYYLLKGHLKKANRRKKGQASVELSPGTNINIHYFPEKVFQNHLFRLKEKKPVGFFLPPSYLEALAQKHQTFISFLYGMEKHFSFSWMSSYADHSYLLLKKRP